MRREVMIGKFSFYLSVLVLLTGCASEEPSIAENTGLSDSGEFYLKYDSDGEHFEFYTDETNGAHYEYSSYDDMVAWAPAWKRFYIEPGNYSDYVYVAIALPIDSSNLSLVELDYNYPIIGGQVSTFYSPCTVLFTRNTSSGSDQEIDGADSLDCFNRVTSIEYVGNHHYDQISQLEVCEYVIEGQFRMNVLNDVSGTVKLLENGLYRFRISVVAE